MSPEYILPLADPRASLETVGGKGASLARLCRANLPVPAGFHVTTAAYQQFVMVNQLQPSILSELEKVDIDQPGSFEIVSQVIQGEFAQVQMPEEVAAAIRQAYTGLGESQPVVAVRSSATAEDLPDLSFAGQQETFLNIQGIPAVLDAVKHCWASLWTARAISYRLQHGIDQNSVSLGVVIQLLVPAEAAGILFTANPVNGHRDEMVINAAWGLGEAIVGGAVNPDLVIVDKKTKRIITRDTATKKVMTARITNGTEERPVAARKQNQAVLSDAEAARLARLGHQIEALYGLPMDIEWAAVGEDFFILQARPITAISDPPPPVNWKLPEGAYVAMRVNIIELMAEPLSPLFEKLGLEVINASMQAMLAGFVGPGIMPECPIIPVNHYAYYNGSLKPMKIARLLFDSVGIAKRMFTAPVERWTEQGRPAYLAVVEKWEASNWRTLSNTETLQAAQELFKSSIDAYWSMVGGVLPAAWISEALFTFFYRILIQRKTDPDASLFLLGFDSVPIRADKSLYTLATWAREQEPLARDLTDTPAKQLAVEITSGEPPEAFVEPAWIEWRKKVQAHLEQYGHTIYNLDFANPVPADDPAPLLETCKLYLSGKGSNPYKRQQAASERRLAAVSAVRKRLKGWRLRQFNRFLASAQRFAPLREDALADVGLAYPLLRQMLHCIGERMAEAGVLERPEEIYWLTQEEVAVTCEKLDRGLAAERLSAVIPERKAALRSAQKATPPMRLPHLSLPWLQKLLARVSRGNERNSLKGVGASAGCITARACVLHGPEDFDQMVSGAVLVAELTTPAWTPLFARAAAIVTDIGGPLSHGSIVAREYGIPAVLGTGVATKRIQNGQTITVDGNAGRVILDSVHRG